MAVDELPLPTDEGGAGETSRADDHAPSGRRRLRRSVIGGVVAAMVIMWAYVLYLAFVPGREPPVDRLDDPSFARAAEPVCAEALERIDRLPVAASVSDATDRAEVLDQANVAYADMLDELDELVPLAPAGEQRERTQEWLSDWRTHLGDRETYAAALRVDPNARLLVTAKPGDGRHITGFIDEFARANRMVSCAEPTDV